MCGSQYSSTRHTCVSSQFQAEFFYSYDDTCTQRGTLHYNSHIIIIAFKAYARCWHANSGKTTQLGLSTLRRPKAWMTTLLCEGVVNSYRGKISIDYPAQGNPQNTLALLNGGIFEASRYRI